MDSGGSSNVTQTQEFKPPSYTNSPTNPYWQDYVSAGAGLSQLGSQPYQGMRTAPMNDAQNAGLQFTLDRAFNGAPDLNAARGQAMQTAQGNYLNSNPYASNQWTDKVIGNNANDMASAFRTGTAAQNDAAMNMQGAFGGSGWALKQSADAAGLAKQVGNMADQTRMNQTNLAAGLYGDERNRMLQASGLAGTLSQDDWTAAKMATGAGDAYGAYTQQLLGDQQALYGEQQQAPWQSLDQFGNVLSRASGSGGSNTATGNQGGYSQLAGLLGLGAGGYAAGKFLGAL